MKNSKGFTLIEILVSLFIIASMLLVYQVSISVLTLNKEIRQKDTALRIANTKMEELRSLDYSSLPESGYFSDPLLSSLPEGQAFLSISESNSKKEATIVISWKDAKGQEKSLSFTTMIVEGGL